MSTLATNKLGTLAGTADLSLPTKRPAATSTGFIDQNGNLSFGSSEASNVSTFVTTDDGKVGKVLFDQVCSTGQSSAEAYNKVNGSSSPFYGIAVGIHNASEDMRTNYLFDGNIRNIEIDFCFYVNTSSTGGINSQMFYTPIDTAGKRLFQVNQSSQSSAASYGYTYENPDSGGGRYNSGSTSYQQPGGANNSLGEDRTHTGNNGGTGKFGKILINCGVNNSYQIMSHSTSWTYNRSSGDMYPISESKFTCGTTGGYTNSGRTQGSGTSSNWGYGSPWTTAGGCLFGGGSQSTAPALNYFIATAYAYIKPTALVTT